MALHPALRKLIESGASRHEMRTGIIPLEPAEYEEDTARMLLIYEVADMISTAMTGPAISACDLAEKIVDEVLGINAECGE